MSTWNDIPTEILEVITTYCGRDCKIVKWMFVNKRWFTFYLSHAYYSINTSLNNESAINKILNSSSFEVGKYVKHILLSNVQKPTNLNEIDFHNNLLSGIMKQTPHVQEVSICRTVSQVKTSGVCQNCSNENCIYQDWPYFSIVLINAGCWKLQFLPALGENNALSAGYYYSCAYYSRRSLKKLELSVGMINSRDFNSLADFTELESLEVHKNLIDNFNDLQLLLPFTPKVKDLRVRFATKRTFTPIKDQSEMLSNIKRLWLSNFTPKNNTELSILTREVSEFEYLCISAVRDTVWLKKIEDPFVIEEFFKSISSIPKYEITMSGNIPALKFSKYWLESLENVKKDVVLLLCFLEDPNRNYKNYETNVVATFYGGLRQSAPLLKCTMTDRDIAESLNILNTEKFSTFTMSGFEHELKMVLYEIVVKERTYLKKLNISHSVFRFYEPQMDAALIPQHIKQIKFSNCDLDLLPLTSFIKEFKSLDSIEFDNCTFRENRYTKKVIDLYDCNIKTIKMKNFRKISSGVTYNDTIQTMIIISIYIVTEQYTRYYSIIDDNLIKISKRTFQVLGDKCNNNEVVILNIEVKSLQELSLQLTNTSKVFNIPFSLSA